MKIVLLIMLAIINIGCVGTGTQITQDQINSLDVGVTTEQEVISIMGKPQSRTMDSEGNVFLSYVYLKVGAFGGGYEQQTAVVYFDSGGLISKFHLSDAKPDGLTIK